MHGNIKRDLVSAFPSIVITSLYIRRNAYRRNHLYLCFTGPNLPEEVKTYLIERGYADTYAVCKGAE